MRGVLCLRTAGTPRAVWWCGEPTAEKRIAAVAGGPPVAAA